MRQTGITGLGMEYDPHFTVLDQPAQPFDALRQGIVIAIIGAVAGNEVFEHALKDFGVEQGMGYQHGVYFRDDCLMVVNDTLPALLIRHGSNDY